VGAPAAPILNGAVPLKTPVECADVLAVPLLT
jgi:hypothetical protein